MESIDLARLKQAAIVVAALAIIYGGVVALWENDDFAVYGGVVMLVIALAGLAWAVTGNRADRR